MKKILTTILSLFYLALSSSAVIGMHYCGGELKDIGINSQLESCCCGDIEISGSCCQNKELNLELDIDQQIVSFDNFVLENIALISDFSYGMDNLLESEIEEIVVENYNIPPPKLEAIWLINCSPTYYG